MSAHDTPATCAIAKRAVRAVVLDAGGVVLYPNLDWIAAGVAAMAGPTTVRHPYDVR